MTASASSAENLLPSERRLIALLGLHGELTKRDLSRKAGLSWSTVSKIMGRFERSGLVRRAGTAARGDGEAGKNAWLYCLDDAYGHVLGIDVEYRRTRVAAKTLSGKVLRTVELLSPARPSLEGFVEFAVGAARAARGRLEGRLLGVGVGMPLWMVRGDAAARREIFRRVEKALARRLGAPARVHNNVRAYATYLAHGKRGAGDFLLVTIRTGLGFAAHVGGAVMAGGDGLAGEMAHFQIDPRGPLCRCGRRGCVETAVNERAMLSDYRAAARRDEATLAGIAELAAHGDRVAAGVLERAADRLAVALSAVVLVLDLSEIVVAGAFGGHGSVFARLVRDRLQATIFPHPELRVRYDSLDSDGFLQGAALLALRDYYEYERPVV